MIIIKTPEEIVKLRAGGPILARILRMVATHVVPGITTKELDTIAHDLIKETGGTPAFLNYTPDGADRPYPASLITSVNSEVVHGIPGDYVLKEGDIIALDLGLKYEGVYLDHAITVGVGEISAKDKQLLSITNSALDEAIAAIGPGSTVGDVGYAVQQFVKPYKLGIVRGLAGHGVGRAIHEDPYIPNYGKKGKGEKFVPGMVVAIEPMLTRGSEEVILLKDGYTLKTPDGSRSAHFEHTILITEDGTPEILTI